MEMAEGWERVPEQARRAWAQHLGCDVNVGDPDVLLAELTATSVPDALATAARTAPDRLLAVGAESTTYPVLADDVDRVASVLVARGRTPGDRVAIRANSLVPELPRSSMGRVVRTQLVARADQ